MERAEREAAPAPGALSCSQPEAEGGPSGERWLPPSTSQRAKFTLFNKNQACIRFSFSFISSGLLVVGPLPCHHCLHICGLGGSATTEFSYYGLRDTAFGPTRASGRFSCAGREELPA